MSDMEIDIIEKDDKLVGNTDIVIEEVKASSSQNDNGLKVEDAISELKSRLEEEQRARRDAEKRAREAESAVVYAKNEVDDTNMHLITGAIDSLKRDASILKSNYKSALASGNYDQAAEIQEQMNSTSNKIMRLEDGKSELEKRPKQEVREMPRTPDPVEEFTSRLSNASADWVRAHPQCVTDPRLNQKMIGAHSIALADGYVVDTPEYFRFIENTMGFNKESPEMSEPTQMSTGGRQAAPSPAPVSRSGSTNGASRPNVVRLNEAEREMADMLGMEYKDYAKNKIELQKAGRL